MSNPGPQDEGDVVTKLSPRSVSATVTRFTDILTAKGVSLFAGYGPERRGSAGWPGVAGNHAGLIRQPGRRHSGDGGRTVGGCRPPAKDRGVGGRVSDRSLLCFAQSPGGPVRPEPGVGQPSSGH